MGNLNKKDIVCKAEEIIIKCEEKYKSETKSKKKFEDLERKYKKLKRVNVIFKILLALAIISILIIIL